MPVLSVTDITKSYGVTPILEKVSFHVEAGEKIGVIGVNGAGKTTLMNILAGKEKSDSGSVFISGDTTLGFLEQQDHFDDNSTLLDETKRIYRRFTRMESELSELSQRISMAANQSVLPPSSADLATDGRGSDSNLAADDRGSDSNLAADGRADSTAKQAAAGSADPDYDSLLRRYGDLQERYSAEGGFTYRSEMRGILSSMAFDESYYDKRIGTLSGGERTRLALACLLMEKPDILLLDEPTNHLDIGMLKWLEQFLKAYRGAILIVSHDRYFLDQIASRIFEIENHKLRAYTGNYTAFAEKKRKIREADLRAYNKQQDEIRRQEDIIRKFKERGTEHLAKRAASREKKLDAMELIDKPESTPGTLRIQFHQKYKSGNDIFTADDLAMSFRYVPLFSGVSFDIKRGERICIVGSNGIGKTTLLRIMNGELAPTGGYLKRGVNLDIGYYDQRQEQLDPDNTVIDEIYDTFRLYKESEIRAFLGRFMFKGDSVFTRVGDLSGGEKARLALLKLMMSGTNVLLLDEPTNHLDIDSREVFEDALLAYPGTVIAVSHDRYFLNKISTRIFEMEAGGITTYVGGYDYYEEKKAEITSTSKYIKGLRDKDTNTRDGFVGRSGSADSAGRGKGAGTRDDFDGKGAGTCNQNDFNGWIEDDTDSAGAPEPKLSAAEERILNKQRQTEQRRLKRQKEKLEHDIESTEQKIDEIQQEMCQPEVLADHKRLNELSDDLNTAKAELDELYEKYMEL